MARWISNISETDPYEGLWPADGFEVSHERDDVEQLRCRECKSLQFLVARGGYRTYIKCSVCGWEECIHSG